MTHPHINIQHSFVIFFFLIPGHSKLSACNFSDSCCATFPPQALRNPGMRERHWDALSAQLGYKLQPEASFTLNKAVEMQLMASLDSITKVSDVAAKEYSIEQVSLSKQAMSKQNFLDNALHAP